MCFQYSTLHLCCADHPQCLVRTALCVVSPYMCLGLGTQALVTDPSLAHACLQVAGQRAPTGISWDLSCSRRAKLRRAALVHELGLVWRNVILRALQVVIDTCSGQSGQKLEGGERIRFIGSTVSGQPSPC